MKKTSLTEKCCECECLSERILQLERTIETLRHIREGEEFINSFSASLNALPFPNATEHTEVQKCGLTLFQEHPALDLADTVSWNTINTTGLPTAPKTSEHNDASHWNCIKNLPL